MGGMKKYGSWSLAVGEQRAVQGSGDPTPKAGKQEGRTGCASGTFSPLRGCQKRQEEPSTYCAGVLGHYPGPAGAPGQARALWAPPRDTACCVSESLPSESRLSGGSRRGPGLHADHPEPLTFCASGHLHEPWAGLQASLVVGTGS